MKEEVYMVQKCRVGHRVDKQLLISLKDIFDDYNHENTFVITVECSNNTQYIFESIDECFESLDKNPYRIVKFKLSVIWGPTLYGNKIEMLFDNTRFANTEVRFRFDNGDEYLLIKNKIEMCLNNYKLNYRFLSQIPIVASISTLGLLIICIYTGYKKIVFPTVIQYLLYGTWIVSIPVSFFWGTGIKRNLFPATEFWIGQNIMIEKKYARFRNFILITLCTGIIVGIIVNGISGFLFQ